MPTPFFDAIRAHATADPDRPSLTLGDQTLSRAELVAGAERVAETFAAQGVGEGDWVTLVLPNCVEFVQASLAAWLLGATPQPISHRLPENEIDAIAELAGSKLVITDASQVAGEDPTQPRASALAPEWKVVTSGGSTGRPKLIVATTPADAEALIPLAQLLQIKENGTILQTGPLTHNAPFVVLTAGLLMGNHVVQMERFDAEETLRLCQDHRVDWLYLVPTMMLRIFKLDNREDFDMSTVKVAFHMAAPCPDWLKEEWIGWLGAETIYELYGGTELQAITICRGDEWLAHRGSVGRAVLGQIEERDGELWMRREDGSIPYRYVGATAKSAEDGWESLGDIGHLDEDGYVYITDRISDMILVGGENVYPAEIEAVLDEHPAVRSSCVIGMPHDDLGNVPYALVELAEDVSDEELAAHVEKLEKIKRPRTFERVTEPIRDDAGKVRRTALRAERVKGAR